MEIGTRAITVDEESRVAEVRRVAAGFAKGIGFDETDVGRVSLTVTEMTTNLLKHASGGEMLLSVFDDGAGAGVQAVSLDKGVGIADIETAMRDGHSTAGSPGTGLGAIRRQADLFEIYSPPGKGAAVLVRLLKRTGAKQAPISSMPRIGVVCVAMAGEQASGDAWSVSHRPDGGLSVMVVDGLGHGPLAAVASHAAVVAYDADSGEPTEALIQKLHLALRPTRGAAASIAELPAAGTSASFIGVGNVAGVLVTPVETRRMVGYNGTLGHALKTVKPFQYDAKGEVLVILASDGLGTSWSLDDYPGLKLRHPSLIAAVLYRDFNRGRDDVTVLVARRAAA